MFQEDPMSRTKREVNVLWVGRSGAIADAVIPSLVGNGHTVLATSSTQGAEPELDLASQESIERFVATLEHQRFDVVVLNSGVGRLAPFLDKPLEDIRREITIGLLGPMLLLRRLKDRLSVGAQIVINSSLNALFHTPTAATYCAAKAGLWAFGHALQHEGPLNGMQTAVLITPPIQSPTFERSMREIRPFLARDLQQKPLSAEKYASWVVRIIEERRSGLCVHPSIWPMVTLDRLLPGFQTRVYHRLLKTLTVNPNLHG
jgi:short-subunit dehydrogenase